MWFLIDGCAKIGYGNSPTYFQDPPFCQKAVSSMVSLNMIILWIIPPTLMIRPKMRDMDGVLMTK